MRVSVPAVSGACKSYLIFIFEIIWACAIGINVIRKERFIIFRCIVTHIHTIQSGIKRIIVSRIVINIISFIVYAVTNDKS